MCFVRKQLGWSSQMCIPVRENSLTKEKKSSPGLRSAAAVRGTAEKCLQVTLLCPSRKVSLSLPGWASYQHTVSGTIGALSAEARSRPMEELAAALSTWQRANIVPGSWGPVWGRMVPEAFQYQERRCGQALLAFSSCGSWPFQDMISSADCKFSGTFMKGKYYQCWRLSREQPR